ncbi:gamma-mobile-trio protein GmtX [Acinetobacter sp. CS-2]|uniref:gamma-mobile-trio protein GmtX n=1 Tax=Acinetobacter sp. CS-2 TaxID=2798861 RepID=UPI001903A900|nr:gamma-mobile-trio protein GmtX [Acinetobacter sp. CS-2]QQN38853.1 hypothetical protein JFY49_12825 [Acinetobacter sp. CS-2]
MEINIEVILEGLKEDKSQRTKDNLDQLNNILKEYTDSGQRDFSITKIGRISLAKGGLAYEALRATRNKHYRTLIEAWAQKFNTNTKKPIVPYARSKKVPKDNQLLERIPDPALRVLFGQIIAERNRYLKEVNLLKQHANITIDKRPVRQFNDPIEPSIEVLPSLLGLLSESEKRALFYAISDECMEKNDWVTTQAGQVKHIEYNSEIFPRGFATGLRKILKELDN